MWAPGHTVAASDLHSLPSSCLSPNCSEPGGGGEILFSWALKGIIAKAVVTMCRLLSDEHVCPALQVPALRPLGSLNVLESEQLEKMSSY